MQADDVQEPKAVALAEVERYTRAALNEALDALYETDHAASVNDALDALYEAGYAAGRASVEQICSACERRDHGQCYGWTEDEDAKCLCPCITVWEDKHLTIDMLQDHLWVTGAEVASRKAHESGHAGLWAECPNCRADREIISERRKPWMYAVTKPEARLE